MPGDEAQVQVSARVFPAERDAIKAHGGLVHLIRKFLADNATEEERLLGGKKALEAQKKEIEAQRKALEEQAIKLDVGIVGFTNRIEALASRERKKSEAGSQKKREKELRLLKKKRGANKIKSPKEWERENKLSYLMQYAAAGKLKQADEERIVQKMKLKPDMVIGWLHSPTPEHISPDLLEKARCHNWGSLPNLQSLKEQDRIKEPFYALLMKWLNLPTKEAVDTWIVKGFEEIEVTKEDERKIQELGKDQDTGKLDSDIINAGMGKSQRDRIKLIREAIRTLQGSNGNDVPMDLILQTLEKEGLKKEYVEDAVARLKTAGELIETSSRRYRTV